MKFSTVCKILFFAVVSTAYVQNNNNQFNNDLNSLNISDEALNSSTFSQNAVELKKRLEKLNDLKSSEKENISDSDVSKGFKNNIGDLTFTCGSWEYTDEGLLSDASGKGDCFAFSKVKGTNFVYSTDVIFKSNEGAASLVFRGNPDVKDGESYIVNVDISSKKFKFFRWNTKEAYPLINDKDVDIELIPNKSYNLKVVAYDSWILYYFDGKLIGSTGDYVVQVEDRGQNTFLKEGDFGLLNWNGKVLFQNTYFKEFDDEFNPILKNIDISSSVGTIENKSTFVPTEPIRIQYVNNDISSVKINTSKMNENTTVEIEDKNGNKYKEGEDIPVDEGINYLIVRSTSISDDVHNKSATATYRMNVHRYKKDSLYYNEPHRDQFHYSLKEGWANDPNGLVYFNGKYHLFHQFFEDNVWGPMHWYHTTSTDLIHWKDEPIALYPDANGAMFSGCIVADVNNDSGLFKGGRGGLVAFISVDGNGQRIKVAYSEDEGITWNKLDKIVIDWTTDPLYNRDLRDPKVFHWEGKWFMVIAGGPLRIYSSDNLIDWKCESTYNHIHTECPDLYPIKASDGKIKWVLSRGGRFYKVGQFKQVDGNWTYIPDEEYESKDGSMNFGKDYYAAMTFYIQDFGSESKPTLPDIISINWMNTWDYCNLVGKTLEQDFNGTFTLAIKLGLIKEGDSYLLTQNPVKNYIDLRKNSLSKEWKGITLEENNELLKTFQGETYEIEAKFYPMEGTKKVGFRVRVGEGEETLIYYDVSKGRMTIDRSKSGVIMNEKFEEIDSQEMSKNEDGSIDMHIYVDRANVEVYSKEGTVSATSQIFPKLNSLGSSILVEGESVKADITIYPLKNIWGNKENDSPIIDEEPSSIGDVENDDDDVVDSEVDNSDDEEFTQIVDGDVDVEEEEDSGDDDSIETEGDLNEEENNSENNSDKHENQKPRKCIVRKH